MDVFHPVFLSHGSPLLALEETPTVAFLRALGQRLGKPRAVVAVSAHWLSRETRVGGAAAPATVHDFGGFPPELYRVQYPAPGAPEIAARVAELIGPSARIDPARGLDHGIWSVAAHLWPGADVPMVPVSIQPQQGPAAQLALGQRLRPLCAQGVLVLGSGSSTHNLAAYMGQRRETPPLAWAMAFADWLDDTARRGDTAALLDYRTRAPHAVANHPTDEHLLPFFVALGAGAGGPATTLHRDMEYGVIGMDAYMFSA